jgi:RNA 2',3'-cyclic 3'-phosphodiesterase
LARLFVALHPPRELACALLEAAGALELPAHRVTPEDQVHMTLAFIGEIPERQVQGIADSVQGAAAGVAAFALQLQALVVLPERGPARLVAATTDSPAALLELRRRLVARLVTRRRKEAPFRPHLTLCRFRAPTRLALQPMALALPPFPVESLSLQGSVLHPAGAVHRQVARFPLALR